MQSKLGQSDAEAYKNHYKLFVDVPSFYYELKCALYLANSQISMMYWVFEFGKYSLELKEILIGRSKAGINVRLMVDFAGILLDSRLNTFKTLQLLSEMKEAGIEIVIINPMSCKNFLRKRMHIKNCAIDEGLLYLGGSNIGDNYLLWQDTNIRISGDFGGVGHALFDIVAKDAMQEKKSSHLDAINDLSTIKLGEARILLTLPGSKIEIRNEIYKMLLMTEGELYIRQWYLFPEKKMLDMLLEKLLNGMKLKILISDKTRVPILDVMNRNMINELVVNGAEVFRYTKSYMHSKAIWTDRGEIILGSANIDGWGLYRNYELCLSLTNFDISQDLSNSFNEDILTSKKLRS